MEITKSKNSSYRHYYESCLGILLPTSIEVHHINHNRSDNNIENLVGLPIRIHREYHIVHAEILSIQDTYTPKGILEKGHRCFGMALDSLNKYDNIRSVVGCWIDYRDYLLGKIPNIHGLDYK